MLLAFCSAFEKSLKQVNAEGHAVGVSESFLGRCKSSVRAVAPLAKKARADDFQPGISQPASSARLLGLLSSFHKREDRTTWLICTEVWNAIHSAR